MHSLLGACPQVFATPIVRCAVLLLEDVFQRENEDKILHHFLGEDEFHNHMVLSFPAA